MEHRRKTPNKYALFMCSLGVKQSDVGMAYCIQTGMSVPLETNKQYSTLNTRFGVNASINRYGYSYYGPKA
jgi:hypothetical protein